MPGAPVAITEDLPELIVADYIDVAPLTDVAEQAVRQVDAGGDVAVGFDADVRAAGAAGTEVLGDDAGLFAAAGAGV